ncbi:hypothetical protein ACOSZF_07375 [Cytobacillus firmus]|uniref:Uncharacterized protein n=1 Tax=Cytobacillus firmus TaxID=1399 RepID=A0A800MY51_CYTFI|nr:hypothetical protein [Cytobacillus firmus]KAF0824579.1 hypothetical protein KIS1582_1643 [Cytobacillus firmus]MDD9311523.1 hypothetical protein [Cytobacillus firmus]MED1941015.1 hypothetical protein [Cytobacillus firmus]NUH82968.1 hypothetical protein [Cytobacillus firmus]
METKNTIELARRIIELDLLRDQLWESLTAAAGDHAYEILRNEQNS